MPEINRSYSNSPIINYGISGTTKKFYHSSKVPLAGYQQIDLDGGKVVYHRYLDGLKGKIAYIGLKDGEFGRRFAILMKDSENTFAFDFVLDKPAFRAFVQFCYNVKFDRTVIIKFYEGKSKETEKTYQNCWIEYPDFPITKPDGKDGFETPERLNIEDCPKEVQRSSGKWDFGSKDDWYFEKGNDIISRFNSEKPKKQPEFQSSGSVAKEVSVEVSDDSDLPF